MDEVSCGGEVGADIEIGEVVGWDPQVAHTAAIEVRTPLTVESPVGGVQHMSDPQFPQLKSVICGGPEKGRKGAEPLGQEGGFFDPCFGKGEIIRVKRELGFIDTELSLRLSAPASEISVGKVGAVGGIFDPFFCLGQPAPSKGKKEEIASALRTSYPSLLATCPTTHKHHLESLSHHVIPATNLQIFRNDTFPDSS